MTFFRSMLLFVCLAAAATPAAASQNAYGGYDVAGPYQANESLYGSARGWDIFKAHDGNRHAYCAAVSGNSGNVARIGYDGLQWQIAVPIRSRPDWSGTLEVDGHVFGFASGTAVDGWTIVWIGLPELDALKTGSRAVVGAGKADYDFSLSGSAAALKKVEECQANGGVPPKAAPPPAGALPPPPAAAAGSTCTDAYDRSFPCSATTLPAEAGYSRALRIDAADGSTSWTIKIRIDTVAEVWIALPAAWNGWKFFGYWQSRGQGGYCIEPGESQYQPQEAIDNMGSDTWSLCIR
jgi:hypothetical protein